MVVVGSVHEKNKIIKDPDQEIYARHFDRSLIRKLSLPRFAQAAHQACCEPVKITAKFQWFWILYIIILFFSYTRTAIQTTTVCMLYVIGYLFLYFSLFFSFLTSNPFCTLHLTDSIAFCHFFS